jgi:hypothetical protein
MGAAVAIGGCEVAAVVGAAAGREVGGLHSGRPIVCSARHLSVVGIEGGRDPHPAMTSEMSTEISKRFIFPFLAFALLWTKSLNPIKGSSEPQR